MHLCHSSNTIYWKDFSFSLELSLLLCQRLVAYLYVTLFRLSILFHSSVSAFFLCYLVHHSLIERLEVGRCPPLCSFSQVLPWLFGIFFLSMWTLDLVCQNLKNIAGWDFDWDCIKVERIDIFTIKDFLKNRRGIFLHF